MFELAADNTQKNQTLAQGQKQNNNQSKHSNVNAVPSTLLQYILKRPIHVMIVCYIIAVITADPEIFLYNRLQIVLIFILPLLLSICLYSFNEIMVDRQRKKRDDMINNRKCKYFTKLYKTYGTLPKKLREDVGKALDLTIINEIKWGDLEIGDIVYLKIGETAPADLVLLDSKDDYACIDTSQMNGDTNIKIKTPFHLTETKRNSGTNSNPFEFRKMLTGKIEYGNNKSDLNEFEAFIKLKKHPNWEVVTNENFIPRGSKLRYTDWVYGMVVYVGLDTKFYLRQNEKSKSTITPKFWSYEEQKQYKFLIILFLIMLIFFIVNVIITTSSSYISEDPFSEKQSTSSIRSENLQIEFLSMLQMIPIYYFLAIDVINFLLLVQGKQAQSSNQVIEPESQNVQIMTDPMKLTKISQVTHVFFNKNSSITTGKFNVRTIGFGNNFLYYFKDYDAIKKYVDKNQNSIPGMKSIAEMQFKSYFNEQSESEEDLLDQDDNQQMIQRRNSIIKERKTSLVKSIHKKPYGDFTVKNLSSLNSERFDDYDDQKKYSLTTTNQSQYMKQLKLGFDQNSNDTTNNLFEGTRLSCSIVASKFGGQTTQQNGLLLSLTQNRIIERSSEMDIDQSSIYEQQRLQRGSSVKEYVPSQYNHQRRTRQSQTQVKSKKSQSLSRYFAKQEKQEAQSEQNSTTRSAQDQNSLNLQQDQNKNQTGQSLTQRDMSSIMNTNVQTNRNIASESKQIEGNKNGESNLETPKDRRPLTTQAAFTSENKSPNQNNLSGNELIVNDKSMQQTQNGNFLKINLLSPQNDIDKTFSQNTLSNYNNNNTNEDNRDKKEQINISENNPTNELNDEIAQWQNQSIVKSHNKEEGGDLQKIQKNYSRSISTNNIIPQHTRNYSAGMTTSQYFNKDERFFSPFKNPSKNRGSGKSPIIIPQVYNSSEVIHKKKTSQNQSSNHRHKRSMVLHDANYEEAKNEIDYLDSLFHPEDHIHYEALIAMGLCQMTRSRYDQTQNRIMNFHQSPEEEAINQFISNFNVFLKCRSDDNDSIKYIVQFLNYYSNYQILAIMEPSKNRKRFSILVRDPNSNEQDNGSILYVKQELDGTKSVPNNYNLTISQKQQVDITITNMLFKGNQVVIYGKREFTEVETSSIISSYNNIYNNVVVDEIMLENLFDQIENELDLLCLVGLEEEIQPDVKETVEMLEKRKVKLNLFSSDKINKALPCGFNIGLLPSMWKLTFLTQSDPESIKYDIKEQIKEITLNLKDGQNNATKSKRSSLNTSVINRKSVQSRRVSVYNMTKMDYQKNFMIIVNKQSLKVIMEDEFLKQHFAFIYYFSKGLIGCELTNEQKSEIYSLVRMMCQEECKIISIGQDNFNTNADINIETRENYKIDCDVRVFSYKGLQELLFYTSRLLQEMYDQILMFTMNRSLVAGILWLVLRSTQQNDMMFSFQQTIFYHFPFYLFGVFNIVADKGCIGWLSQIYHKSCSEKREFVQVQNSTMPTQMPLQSERMIPNAFTSNKETSLKNEQDFRIITSSLQFRSAQALLQQAMLLKKFIVTCVIASSVEVAVLILSIYFFGALQSVSGMILPSIFSIRVLFLVVNWVGQIRIMIDCYQYNLRQFIISLAFLIGISILYIFVDTDEQDQLTINEAWGSPQLWFLIITIFISQILLMIIIQYIEIRLYIGIDLFRELSYTQLNRILSYAQNLRLIIIRKVDTSSFNLMIFIKKLFANVDMDLTIQQLLNPENSLVNNTKINRFTLSFINNDAQKRFEEEEYSHSIIQTKRSFIIFIFIQAYFLIEFNDLIFGTIGTSLNSVSSDEVERRNDIILERVYMALYIFLVGVILIQKGYFLGMFSESKNNGQFSGVLLRMHYLKLLLYILIIVICQNKEFLMLFILLVYSNVHFIIMPFHQIFFTTIVLTIIYLTLKIINLLNDREYFLILFQPVIVFSYFIFVISQKYLFYRRQKKNFIQQYELNIQNRKINDVLEILLPKFIINRIKSNDPNKPFRFQEKQGEASIIFCDICHFDDIIKEKNEKIIPFLDKVFKSFDKFCARSGLQKIETVGKTYMASAGLKDFEDQVDPREREVDPVERAANLALEMIEYVKDLKWSQSGKNLELKIGIHYGQVIAGVIGHHKPQFSLIGDTVNTTSRVCSKGNASEITLSQEAYDKIKGKTNKFAFSEPKVVFAKGKGDITLYTLKKYNPAIHKKKQTIIKPSKVKEDTELIFKYPPITSKPKERKRRSSKRSLTTKYNPTTEIGKLPRTPQNNNNIQALELVQEINKVRKPTVRINNFNTEQALAPVPVTQHKSAIQASIELHSHQNRNQRSQTNEQFQFVSKSKRKIEIEPPKHIEEVPNSPTSPEQQTLQQIRSKNMSSFHRQHYKNNTTQQGITSNSYHKSNSIYIHSDQNNLQNRIHRTDSIKLAISPLREQEDENSPTREIYKRTLHIPGNSPKAVSGAVALNGRPQKRPVLMHSGTFYVTSSSEQKQQQPQLNHQQINQNLIMSRHQLTGSGFQRNKSHNQTYLNSQTLYDSMHNLRQFAVGHPVKAGICNSGGLQNNIIHQIANNCKEEVCVRILENYQDKFQIDFLRAQQFLFNDKEEEHKQIDGQDFQELSINDLLFKTTDQDKVDEFYNSVVESSQSHILQYTGLALLVCILKTIGLIIFLLTEDLDQKDIGINIGFRCFIIFFLCFFIFKNQLIIQAEFLDQFHFAAILTLILFMSLITLSLYEIIFYDEKFVRVQILEQMIYYLIFSNQNFIKLNFRIVFAIIMLISIIISQSLSGTQYFSSYYFFFSCTIFHAFKYYMIFSLLIKNYNTMRILDSKKQQKDNLVKNLIPKHLLEYFNVKSIAQQSDLSDVFEVATLLFADITDFTKYCSMRNPEEVVNMLSNLFLKFDMKCQELKCFKVYTIGDCYVVLGVDNAKDRNPAQEANNVVQMAFNMLDIIKQVRKEVEFETLNMRIGVHTGQIIGGITGSDIVRYDIYGTDVMISNKMESNGQPGKIMVSQTTKDLLESAYESSYIFTEGAMVQDVQGYFIHKRLDFESQIIIEQQISQNQYMADDGHHFFDQGIEGADDSPFNSSRNQQQRVVQINEFGDEVIGDSEHYNHNNNQNNDFNSNIENNDHQIEIVQSNEGNDENKRKSF